MPIELNILRLFIACERVTTRSFESSITRNIFPFIASNASSFPFDTLEDSVEFILLDVLLSEEIKKKIIAEEKMK